MRYFGRLYDQTSAGVVINIDCEWNNFFTMARKYPKCNLKNLFSVASKSADLSSISDDEPESFTDAKESIIELITRWATEEPPTEPPVSPTPEPEFY